MLVAGDCVEKEGELFAPYLSAESEFWPPTDKSRNSTECQATIGTRVGELTKRIFSGGILIEMMKGGAEHDKSQL